MNFSDVENKFFWAVIYGILHKKLNGMNVRLENVKETLGDKLFFDLKEIEQSIKRDYPVFNFFDRCQKINEVLLNNGYFLRFYERRNKFQKMNQDKNFLRVLFKNLSGMKYWEII